MSRAMQQAENRELDTEQATEEAIPPSPRARTISGYAPAGEIAENEDTIRDARVPWFKLRPHTVADLRDTISGFARDTMSGLSLSLTWRPLAARLRSVSLLQVFAFAALAVAGIAWYLSKTLPPETAAARSAPSIPAQSIPAPSIPAPSIPEEISAPPEPRALAPVEVTTVAPRAASKPPIDVSSLPLAPPAGARAKRSSGAASDSAPAKRSSTSR